MGQKIRSDPTLNRKVILYDPRPGESRHCGNGNTGLAGATSRNDTPVTKEQTFYIVRLKPWIDHRVLRVHTGTAGSHGVEVTPVGAYPLTNVTTRADILETHSL